MVSNQGPIHLAKGAGVYAVKGGTIRNTLIANNTAFEWWAQARGGGAYLSGKPDGRPEMINCTLTGNGAPNGGGGVYLEGINLSNAVINYITYDNFDNVAGTNPDDIGMDNASSSNAFTHCCLPLTLPSEQACVADNPQFVADDKGCYQLRSSSPCVNTGINQAWMTKSFDLDGERRMLGGQVDIGAYEFRSKETQVFLR